MYLGEKKHIHSRSFHRRIREGAVHFFDTNHFLCMDPLDHCRFHNTNEDDQHVRKMEVLTKEDVSHLISNW